MTKSQWTDVLGTVDAASFARVGPLISYILSNISARLNCASDGLPGDNAIFGPSISSPDIVASFDNGRVLRLLSFLSCALFEMDFFFLCDQTLARALRDRLTNRNLPLCPYSVQFSFITLFPSTFDFLLKSNIMDLAVILVHSTYFLLIFISIPLLTTSTFGENVLCLMNRQQNFS